MLRIAILTARSRIGTFAGALLAFFASGVLAMSGGMLLEAALRTHPPVERYAAATAVVTGQQIVGSHHDVVLGERARVSASLVMRLAGVPGVRAAVADLSVPARLGDRSGELHGWSSSALTPYALITGRAPTRPEEVVTGYRSKLGARLTLSSTEKARPVTVVGNALPRHPVPSQAAIFSTDAEAARLAANPGRVDAIGILAGHGSDINRLRAAAPGAAVLTGHARGRAEFPELQERQTTLVAVSASFAGVGIFLALFVVIGTMALSIQQREQEIA